jgi:hypothetical protein
MHWWIAETGCLSLAFVAPANNVGSGKVEPEKENTDKPG